MARGWTLLVLGTLCLSAFMHTCTATTTTAVSSTVTAGRAVGGGSNTGPGGCTDTVTAGVVDMGRQGGTQLAAGAGSLSDCQQQCLSMARSACGAFEWVNPPTGGTTACWIFTEALANTDVNNRQGEGITVYDRIACDAATTTPTSTPAVGACTDTFTIFLNTNYNGGVRTPDAGNTAALCTAYCLTLPTCTGLDINLSNGACWLHTQNTFTTGGNPSGVNHHRRVACNATSGGSTVCVDGFTEARGMQLFGGSARSGDALACAAACLAEPFCTAYEINTANRCYLHFNNTDTPAPNSNTNHRLFTRVPCITGSTLSGVCRDNFTPRPNTNVFDGVAKPDFTTVESCQSVCLEQSNPPCTAFDFSSFGQIRCYTFTSVTRAYTPSTDVTHYERDFRCNGTVTGSGCVETYSSTLNSNRDGGVRQPSINNNVLCSEGCSRLGVEADSTACYGYDFNANSDECYFHIGSIPSQTGDFSGVTSYVRGFVCSRSTTLGGGCRDVYTPTANSNVFGGIEAISNANTETLCRAACSATIEGQADYCFGYDFDSNNNRCFFIRMASYDISPGASGVTHYNRRRECPGSTITGCAEAYNSTENRNAANGIDIGAQTVESCGSACLARNTTCYGFDFANGNCWLLLSEYALNPGPANGVTNYRRLFNCGGTTTGGGCVPTYTLRNNIIVYGGVGAAGSDTVATCAAACTADTNCVAYNYVRVPRDASDGRCFLIRGSVGTENPNNDLDLYVQDNNCASQTTPSVTQCRMVLLGSGNVNGGTFVPNTNTLEACQVWCIANVPCLAVDWDSTSNQCFWFTTTSTRASGSSCCEHFNKVCEDTCIDTFNVTAGIGYFGGMEVLNRPTVMDCQTACAERGLCAGFDFNTEVGACFTHVLANFDRSYTFAGVSNYRRVRCPGGTPGRTTLPTTIRTTACPDRYTAISNSNAPNGVRDNSGNSVASCQRICSDNSLCTAVDYSTGGCWIHTGTTVVNTNPASGVTHYQRRPCQDITPPPTITPAPITPAPITPSPQGCNTDIIFLVDAIDPSLLDQMGLVIQQIVNGLNIGNNFVRVSLHTVGITDSGLVQLSNLRAFLEILAENLQVERGPNNLPLALRNFLQTEYLISRAANRESVLIIMSDLNIGQGFINNLADLRNQLVQIPTFVVTFNNALNTNHFINFSPFLTRIFHIESVRTAIRILDQINAVCRSNTALTPRPGVVTPAPTPRPRQCLGDIAILIDDSGSIREAASRGEVDNWPIVLNFVRDIIRSLRIGSQSTRVAIVTFSDDASVIYRFNDRQDTNDVQQRIELNVIPYTGGNTNLMAGLRLVRTQIFTPQAGDRPVEPNVVILITDGRPTGGNDNMLRAEITQLRQVSEIIPVGVTSSVDTNILQLLASNNNNVFNVQNFAQLNTIISQVVDASCNALRR